MNIVKLKQFLINAKKNTYASGGENKSKIILNGAKEYIFNDNDFKYIDRYRGHEKFSGEEKIFYKDEPVYSLTYNGKII